MLLSAANGLPFYNAFTAYNSKDKMVYYADISTAGVTRVYAVDYNLRGQLTSQMLGAPTYTYNYTIDQLCFDKDGNNIAIYNYNNGTATARIKQIDLATGEDIPGTNQQLNFPMGNQPNSLGWGDVVYMPNGRIFMSFGNSPSKLYELINYDGSGAATAVFLADIPKPCYSIGYVDGNLIVGGSDGSSCYYYVWDINSNVLGTEKVFPLGKTTADITHVNVGVGVSEEFTGGNILNANTADIIYQIVIKNKGNIDLAVAQASNNLATTYGAGNISNVVTSFISNPAGLILNPSYNGDTDTLLLKPGQSISNYPVGIDSVIIRLQFRATNLTPNKIYYNSTIGSGEVGAGSNLMQVRDSSNNGNAAYIDLDFNGVSDDTGEGYPTPFSYTVLLPVNNLQFTASLKNSIVALNWSTSDEYGLDKYEVERSVDGVHYSVVYSTVAVNRAGANYEKSDNITGSISSVIYYRLKVIDSKGGFKYSKTIPVRLTQSATSVSVYPNPFVSSVTVQVASNSRGNAKVLLFDAMGRMVKSTQATIQEGNNFISISDLQDLSKGIYMLEIINGNQKEHHRLVK